MPMTPEQVRLVQESFRDVFPVRATAARIFYERLFAIDPEVRTMFAADDMAKQGAMLMTALSFVLHGLDRLDTILPTVRGLAQRHVHYGVEDRHYALVGQALIETLAAALGSAFTGEVRAAWQAAYATLERVMIEAAGDEAVAA
jgi:hemoglobin-like flavoprotein